MSMSPSPSSPPNFGALAPARVGPWRIVGRTLAALVFAAWSILLLAWLILHWGILPHIDEWRPRIEQQAGKALGVPVAIGAIRVRSSGWVPAFELDDVVLRESDGREALRLPRVLAAVSARSLLAFELRFEQLLIDGPRLAVRRDSGGRLHVAGLDMGGGEAGSGELADWFFEQHEFVIRNGTLQWTDEQRGAPPLALTAVELVVRNGFSSHLLRLDATPPPEWGERFSLRGRFRHSLLARNGDWSRWSGVLHASLPHANLAQLKHHLTLPFELNEGEGALRAWLDLTRGEARSATVDLALRAVSLRLGDQVQPLAVQQLEGRLALTRDARGFNFVAQNFSFAAADGVAWPKGNLRLVLAQPVAEAAPRSLADAPVMSALQGGEFSADRIDLATMASVAARVPLGGALNRLLDTLAPRGLVEGLNARWEGSLDAPGRYHVKARLSGLTLAAAAAAPPASAAAPTAAAAASPLTRTAGARAPLAKAPASAAEDGAPPNAGEPPAIGRPGLRNAAIVLDAGEQGGNATLAIQQGTLTFPGVLEEPEIAMDRLAATLSWRIEPQAAGAPPRIEVKVREARFANADAQGELEATWRTGAGEATARGGRFPGVLELSGRLTRGRATAAARYLPLGIPAGAREYVRRSVRAGEVKQASFKVRGDIWDFPFHNARDGEFRVVAQLAGVEFQAVPGDAAAANAAEPRWPAFTQVAGGLEFERSAMRLRDVQGRVAGVELSGINGGVASFRDQPTVAIEGVGRGPLGDMLRYVNATPVGDWIGGSLKGAVASGNAELKLALALPLLALDSSTVRGSVVLPGNDLRLRPDVPLLGQAKARVEFSQKSFSVAGGNTRVLGGELAFDGGLQSDGALRFSGQGNASTDGLKRAVEFPLLPRLAESLSGQAAYRVQLGFLRGQTELMINSNLVGMVSSLPAPLNKAAELAWPLRVQTTLAVDGSARDTLRVELANLLQAQYQRDLSRGAPQVRQGALALGAELPTAPAAGVIASLNLGMVDLDAWRAVATRFATPPAAPAAAAAPAGSPVSTPAEGNAGYLPHTIALRARELGTGGRRLSNLVAGVTHTEADGLWRANLDADQLAGLVEYQEGRSAAASAPASASAAGRVFARLSRLSLPPADAEQVTKLLDEAPATVPALDIVVEEFELRGRKLGRLEIDAVNRGAGERPADGARDSSREWRLNRLNLTTPEARLSASGQWAASAGAGAGTAAARRRMVMDFKLELADSGALLARLGFGRVLRDGKGRMSGQLSWLGSPLSPHVPSLTGQVDLALDSGQFLKVAPGAGRLLSVLSLQALPRRLSLDFRDLFQEGFSFDNVAGEVAVQGGVASTNNLRMRGVQAAVLLEGRTDIERETQDLRVVVVPEINAGTASLAYAAINPAIGLGTFVAQLLFRKQLAAVGTREFHVHGSWADPKVDRVERRADGSEAEAGAPGAAAQSAAPAAAAGSAPRPATP